MVQYIYRAYNGCTLCLLHNDAENERLRDAAFSHFNHPHSQRVVDGTDNRETMEADGSLVKVDHMSVPSRSQVQYHCLSSNAPHTVTPGF